MAIPVIGLGAGGHAKVVIEILRLCNRYEPVGLLDRNPELRGEQILGVPILGDDSLIEELMLGGVGHFFVGLGGAADLQPRRRLFETAIEQGLTPVVAIHPGSILSPTVSMELGITVGAGAIINAEAWLGENVIINSGAIVEHDCRIGAHSHIATGAHLAGGVEVGSGTLIGIGSAVRQGIVIGASCVIGAGSVVVKPVGDYQTAFGNPARIYQKEINEAI